MAVKNSRCQFLLQTPSGHVAILQFMHELPFFLYTWELSQVEYSLKQDGKVLIKMLNKIGIPSGLSYQKFTCVLALRVEARRLAVVSWLWRWIGSKMLEIPNYGSVATWQKMSALTVLRSLGVALDTQHSSLCVVQNSGTPMGPLPGAAGFRGTLAEGCHHITLSSPVMQSYL